MPCLSGGDKLISELKPVFQPRLYGSPGCETWSVCFSPDGTRFAWSAGYGLVRVLPWPLPSNLYVKPRSKYQTNPQSWNDLRFCVVVINCQKRQFFCQFYSDCVVWTASGAPNGLVFGLCGRFLVSTPTFSPINHRFLTVPSDKPIIQLYLSCLRANLRRYPYNSALMAWTIQGPLQECISSKMVKCSLRGSPSMTTFEP